MKKFVIFFLFALFLVGFGGSASALVLMDTTLFTETGTIAEEDYIDHGWGDVNVLSGPSFSEGFDYVQWAHQYTFDPPAGSINFAQLVLTFEDDELDTKCNIFSWELGFGISESLEWDFGAIDTGDYTYDIDVAYVGDGYFELWVASAWGDFSIVSSVLTIDYNAAAVPEPATLLLLGTGLFALAGISRKKVLK